MESADSEQDYRFEKKDQPHFPTCNYGIVLPEKYVHTLAEKVNTASKFSHDKLVPRNLSRRSLLKMSLIGGAALGALTLAPKEAKSETLGTGREVNPNPMHFFEDDNYVLERPYAKNLDGSKTLIETVEFACTDLFFSEQTQGRNDANNSLYRQRIYNGIDSVKPFFRKYFDIDITCKQEAKELNAIVSYYDANAGAIIDSLSPTPPITHGILAVNLLIPWINNDITQTNPNLTYRAKPVPNGGGIILDGPIVTNDEFFAVFPYYLAHELGHVLGYDHDSENTDCNMYSSSNPPPGLGVDRPRRQHLNDLKYSYMK